MGAAAGGTRRIPWRTPKAWQPARARTSELAALAVLPAAHSHLDVPRTALLIAAIAAVWVLTLLVHPFGKCWRCRGKRVRIIRGGRKAKRCWACKGTGRRQRTGSRTVHRIRRTAVAGWQARKDRA